MTFDNRHYVIIPSSEVNQVNFNEVLETSAETCRYSVDGSKTFVKYEGNQPESLLAIANKSKEYTHYEIFEILASSEWTAEQQLL